MVAVQTEERDTYEEEVRTPTLDRDVGGDVLNLICNFVLVVKARTKLLNKTHGWPSYSPTVARECLHIKCTVGLYDGNPNDLYSELQ